MTYFHYFTASESCNYFGSAFAKTINKFPTYLILQPIIKSIKSVIFSGTHTEKLLSLIEKSLIMLSCCY